MVLGYVVSVGSFGLVSKLLWLDPAPHFLLLLLLAVRVPNELSSSSFRVPQVGVVVMVVVILVGVGSVDPLLISLL